MSRHLPEELLWENDHASDLVIGALADGEGSLVPRSVESHVQSCAFCTHRMGEAALLSMSASRAITELGPLVRITPVPATVRRRLPIPMIAAALVLAAIGAVPTLIHLPNRLAELCVALLHTAPTLSRGSVRLLQNGLGPTWMAMTCVSGVLLLMGGYAVTRLLPKPVAR